MNQFTAMSDDMEEQEELLNKNQAPIIQPRKVDYVWTGIATIISIIGTAFVIAYANHPAAFDDYWLICLFSTIHSYFWTAIFVSYAAKEKKISDTIARATSYISCVYLLYAFFIGITLLFSGDYNDIRKNLANEFPAFYGFYIWIMIYVFINTIIFLSIFFMAACLPRKPALPQTPDYGAALP
jgi:hypothetical protein